MAEATSLTSEFNAATERPSRLKEAFQYVGAFLAPFNGDACSTGFVRAGHIWDYCKARLGQ